jgi:hypothetical protein
MEMFSVCLRGIVRLNNFNSLRSLEQLVEGLASFSGETINIVALLRTTIIDDISTLTIKYVQRVINVP